MWRLIISVLLVSFFNQLAIAQVRPAKNVLVRTWKSAAGSHEVKASLVLSDKEKVVLKRAEDGIEVSVPLEKLSASDQQWLEAMKQLEGPWEATAWEFGGTSVPPPDKMRMVVDRGTFTVTAPEKGYDGTGTIDLDPSKSPKHCNMRDVRLDSARQCIYEISGDTLKICSPSPEGEDRPTELTSTKENKQLLLTYKRAAK